MRIEFPYVRVTPLGGEGLPQPVLLIALDGIDPTRRRPLSERTGHLHSHLPVRWLLPAVAAGLETVGVTVPDEWVNRGGAWLAWVDMDASQIEPDLTAIDFAKFVGVRNG